MLALLSPETCSHCKGSGLQPERLEIKIAQHSILDLKAKSLYDFTKYGAASGAIVSSLGYVPEELDGFVVDKDASTINIVLWATPDDAETYTLVYDYIQRIEDTGNIASNNADVPARYLPCLTYALAYNLACKMPEAINRVPMIKQRYDELWRDVSDADREKASVRFVPDSMIY